MPAWKLSSCPHLFIKRSIEYQMYCLVTPSLFSISVTSRFFSKEISKEKITSGNKNVEKQRTKELNNQRTSRCLLWTHSLKNTMSTLTIGETTYCSQLLLIFIFLRAISLWNSNYKCFKDLQIHEYLSGLAMVFSALNVMVCWKHCHKNSC